MNKFHFVFKEIILNKKKKLFGKIESSHRKTFLRDSLN